ncbi:MAG: hypothetical protein O3A19_08380, partial [Planctomycetota bacterium]|nr:hypothetical protein [Planctomycetota bacterium]
SVVASGLGVGLLAESCDSPEAAWSSIGVMVVSMTASTASDVLPGETLGYRRPHARRIVPAGWLSQMQVFQAPLVWCRGVLVAIDRVGRGHTVG